jgi:hypothetical protein
MSVEGTVRPSGQALVDALKELKPAPAPQRTALAVLAANGGRIAVSGYPLDAKVTGAVAKAAESSGADPESLKTIEAIKETLDPALHEQGVCI